MKAVRDKLLELLDVMGLDPALGSEVDIPAGIMELVERRQAAKKERDFALADSLRDEIAAAGYKIEDTPQGPKVTVS